MVSCLLSGKRAAEAVRVLGKEQAVGGGGHGVFIGGREASLLDLAADELVRGVSRRSLSLRASDERLNLWLRHDSILSACSENVYFKHYAIGPQAILRASVLST